MQKVLIVSNSTFPYYTDGQSVVVDILRKGLQNEGFSVEILTILPHEDKKKISEYDGTKYNYLNISSDIRYDSSKMLFTKDGYINKSVEGEFSKLLDDLRPDVVNFHSIEGIGANLIELVKKKDIKVVINLHDYSWICPHPFMLKDNGQPYLERKMDYEEWGRAIGGWEEYIRDHENVDIPTFIKSKFDYLKKVLNSVDKVIAPSNYLRNDYISNGFPENKIITIPNAVPEIKEKYSMKNDSETLVFGHLAGYGGRGKGVDVAVEAFKNLDPKINARLEVIANDGISDNPKFKKLFTNLKLIKAPVLMIKEYYHFLKDLKDWFKRRFSPGRITYWPKYKPEDRFKVISRLDCVIVSSIYRESFSLTTAEALSYGIPVIASNRGGMVDMIKDGVNGFLFEQGDSNALKEAIEKVAANRILFRSMCQNALEFHPLNETEYAQNLIEVYKSL